MVRAGRIGTLICWDQWYPEAARLMALAGAALLPFVLLMFLFSRWSGGLVEHFGARRPLILGPAIAAAGFHFVADCSMLRLPRSIRN